MRLLVDEMYTPEIVEQLQDCGHDAVSAGARPALRSAPDDVLFDVAQAEHRVLVTNNVRDFMPLTHEALQNERTFYGIVFTSDRSLPRSKGTIGTYIDLLHRLLTAHRDEERLPSGITWLRHERPARAGGPTSS